MFRRPSWCHQHVLNYREKYIADAGKFSHIQGMLRSGIDEKLQTATAVCFDSVLLLYITIVYILVLGISS